MSNLTRLKARARKLKQRALRLHILASADDRPSVASALQRQAEASERLSVKYQNYVDTRLTAPEESGSMKPPEQ